MAALFEELTVIPIGAGMNSMAELELCGLELLRKEAIAPSART